MNPKKFNTEAWRCDSCETAHLQHEAAVECCRVVPCICCWRDIPSPEYADHPACIDCRGDRIPECETATVEEFQEDLIKSIGTKRWLSDPYAHRLAGLAVEIYHKLVETERVLREHSIPTVRDRDAVQAERSRIMHESMMRALFPTNGGD